MAFWTVLVAWGAMMLETLKDAEKSKLIVVPVEFT